MVNFNQERLKVVDDLTQLQNQVNNLVEDLDRYKKRPNASEKFIFFKSQQIKILESCINGFNEFTDNTNLIFKEQQKQIKELNAQNDKLTLVCLLHGISNLSYYLNHSVKQLVALLKQALKDNFRQIPFEIHYKDEPKNTNPQTAKTPVVNFTDLHNKAKENYIQN